MTTTATTALPTLGNKTGPERQAVLDELVTSGVDLPAEWLLAQLQDTVGLLAAVQRYAALTPDEARRHAAGRAAARKVLEAGA